MIGKENAWVAKARLSVALTNQLRLCWLGLSPAASGQGAAHEKPARTGGGDYMKFTLKRKTQCFRCGKEYIRKWAKLYCSQCSDLNYQNMSYKNNGFAQNLEHEEKNLAEFLAKLGQNEALIRQT